MREVLSRMTIPYVFGPAAILHRIFVIVLRKVSVEPSTDEQRYPWDC
jgi:hypothetical protein